MSEQVGPPPLSSAFVLSAAGRVARETMEAELASVDLSLRLLGALGHLARAEDVTVSELARRAGVTAQSMHATIGELEARGAVTRSASGRGRRAAVHVTDEGHRQLVAGRAAVSRADAAVVERLGGALPPDVLVRLARLLG